MMSLKFAMLMSFLGMSLGNLRADFEGFMSQFGEHYTREEVRLRYRLYKESRESVEQHNSQHGRQWDMAINQFSAMTDAERSQYLGLRNASDWVEMVEAVPVEPDYQLGGAESVDHVALGHVTQPKDQRSCGSCWSFAAVAAFEGAYARATNILKSFSEKELLDCAYSDRDGCQGGFYTAGWNYIRQNQRLASLKDAPYDYARDRDCDYGDQFNGRVPNGIKNARYDTYHAVSRSDEGLENALSRNVLAVAMVVESDFYSYGSGIYSGCSSHQDISHAVTMVGYTRDAWKVKNSWGRYWGESGYVRFSRARRNNCKLADYADEADPPVVRRREPNHGCAFGDDYPCSDMNCNYGCQDGHCWSHCNGVCAITGDTERCGSCLEWCWTNGKCSKHEDCSPHRYDSCTSACSV